MKNIKLSIAGTIVLFLMFSCSSNKQAELTKLKQQQSDISDKIKNMELAIGSGTKDSMNPEKFKLVVLKEVNSNTFDHFIRVQGKLDGDQNAAVFAEAPGTADHQSGLIPAL